ncbi:MAG TPA: GreA/GreB family elongation factor [Flavobacterium sp.]|jgi:regulator of nucleoside diphosphate kinase|uniref:GreA/GreB family elongation factor n=1 Tax=Flavobacterium sp. TaxID=239 RepID=UPI001B663FB3|nr:GreA/GreB family elongation factor [Flavobacterium sp.]MBP6145582.1 GreA/GreB family elongation factor [Flavobacterium sp.]MBP7181463.1 GreA/GreB family elongation factor [Flavobacterium sp.]MBP7316712.1 GreA/GreB family elongation factor [Flavobacterium sp.]MBP8885746.1 GreA/GreB family elongation factor [Flavobacterium sp.]HRL70474.1 GreA/GreB family elongation factor [Flavobacterium sp.]
MKPTPTLTITDYNILRELVKSAKDATNIREIALLTQELDRAIVNKEDVFDESIVRMKSKVTVEDLTTKQQMKIQIVMPSQSNIKEGKVSILAPICVAIIGFKENDEVEWQLPSGIKTLKIIAVANTASN